MRFRGVVYGCVLGVWATGGYKFPAGGPEARTPLAIIGATIIDGNGGARIADGTMVIEGDRISAVGDRASVAVPEGAEVIDGSGKFVTPGFVDTNVHMSLAFGRGTRVEEHAAYWAHHEQLILQGLQLHLKHGVTTVRDSYGVLRPMRRVKKQIDSGEEIGPRTYLAGNIVGWGGSASEAFAGLPESEISFFAEQMNDEVTLGSGEEMTHDAGRAAGRDQRLPRSRAEFHQVRRHAPLLLSRRDLVLASRPARDRRGDAQAWARGRDPRYELRRPAPLDPRGHRPHPAPGQRREPHDNR
ncbi:amidohydrolase family protein [Candidatus Palauibacter sp.]|uniref:amidohydrolase family protein n=1 Tax=Candidatus Palauibacter sp. TaxID=3101350 RepID=UPI003AF24FAB